MRRFHFDATDSTNTQARRLSELHPGEVLLVTAAEQSSGRGRQGRTWHSPRGGAWMSIVWPLRKKPAEYAAASLAAAVAVTRALQEIAPQCAGDLQIKWPNDILLNGEKVAGILCELQPGRGELGAGALIIGIGINAAFDPDRLQKDLRHPATTLQAAVEGPVIVEEVITAVAHQLSLALTTLENEGLGPALLPELRRRLAYVGAVRTWSAEKGVVAGRVVGVDAAGRLLLDTDAGQVTCSAGELLPDNSTPGEDAL